MRTIRTLRPQPHPLTLAAIAAGGLALLVTGDVQAQDEPDAMDTVREVELVDHCIAEVQVEAIGDVERGWIVDFSRVEVDELTLDPTSAVLAIEASDPNAAHAYVSDCSELEACDDFTRWRDDQVAGGSPVKLIADGDAPVAFHAASGMNAELNASRLLATMTKLATSCSTI